MTENGERIGLCFAGTRLLVRCRLAAGDFLAIAVAYEGAFPGSHGLCSAQGARAAVRNVYGRSVAA
jgi:hypothetical protein